MIICDASAVQLPDGKVQRRKAHLRRMGSGCLFLLLDREVFVPTAIKTKPTTIEMMTAHLRFHHAPMTAPSATARSRDVLGLSRTEDSKLFSLERTRARVRSKESRAYWPTSSQVSPTDPTARPAALCTA
jgi:hypothetical protein